MLWRVITNNAFVVWRHDDEQNHNNVMACARIHGLPLFLMLQCTHVMQATKQLTWEQGCTPQNRVEWDQRRQLSWQCKTTLENTHKTKAEEGTIRTRQQQRRDGCSVNKKTEEMSPMPERSSSLLGSELQQVKAYNGWTVETRSCRLPSPSVISCFDLSGQLLFTSSTLIFFFYFKSDVITFYAIAYAWRRMRSVKLYEQVYRKPSKLCTFILTWNIIKSTWARTRGHLMRTSCIF